MITEIPIKIKINNALHIGSEIKEDENIDKPILKKKSEYGVFIPYIPGNVLRGVLRRLGYNIYLKCINIFNPTANKSINFYGENIPPTELIQHPFFTLFGGPGIPSKIQYSEGSYNKEESSFISLMTGIKINRISLSTQKTALFTFERAEISEIEFTLKVYDLNDREKALLISALNGLKYSSIGGRITIGCGFIKDIEINKESFVKDAMNCLQDLINKSKNNKN